MALFGTMAIITANAAYGIALVLLASMVSLVLWAPLPRPGRFRQRRTLGRLFMATALLLGLILLVLVKSTPSPAHATDETPPDAPNGLPSPAILAAATLAPPATQPNRRTLYTDNTVGYSIQLPPGWTCQSFPDGNPWILAATDEQAGLITVGLSAFPSDVSPDRLTPAMIAQRIPVIQPDTLIHAAGPCQIDRHPAVWMNYTAALPMADGGFIMTMIHYLVPLDDGRALELRLAATPDQFPRLLSQMKRAVSSLRLLDR